MQNSQRPRYLVHAALILVCFLMAFPVLYAFQVSTLTDIEALENDPPNLFPPSDDFFLNTHQIFERNNFYQLLLNTFLVSIVVVIGKTATAMLAGLAFVYYRFPGKTFLFFAILLTLFMPTEIIILPLFQLVSDFGWAKDHARLALTMPFLASAIGAFLFRQHFSNIPRELAEAAQLDGASPLRFMVSVLLPMSWNIIGAMVVIQFIYMWHQFLWPKFVITTPEEQMIQVGILDTTNVSTQADMGVLMAAGIVASIPPVIVFILLQKQFMSGFALTRDK